MLPAGAGGTIIGGVLIERLKLNCSQIIRIQTVLTAIVTAGILLLLLTCSPLDFAGVNMAYNTSISSSLLSDPVNLTNVCNIGCDCEQVAYSPICSHDNIMYYSPCHAGCSHMEDGGDTKSYYNCSCIASPADSTQAEATSDACSAGFCPISIFFMVAFFFAVACIFICFTANLAATFRCVSSSQTSFALGTQCLFVKIIGTIVGPLVMGVSFDKSCVLWEYDECGEGGSCLFYDNKDLAIELFIVCFTIKIISLVTTVLATIIYKPPRTVEPLVDVPVPDRLVDSRLTANGNDKVPVTTAVVAAGETNEAFEDHSIHL